MQQLRMKQQQGQRQQQQGQRIFDAIDLVRQHCFDLSMQYQALFPAETDLPLIALHFTSVVDNVMLEQHVRAHVAQQITTGELVYRLADRLLHCGNTLARIGHEIRDHVIFDIVESRLVFLLDAMLTSSLDAFSAEMNNFLLDSVVVVDDGASVGSDETDVNSLLRYPPLARVTNGFLRALNELRQCAPVSMRTTIVGLFDKHLDRVQEIITTKASVSDDANGQLMPLTPPGKEPHSVVADVSNERLQWNRMVHCMRVHCIGHIRNCLESIYGGIIATKNDDTNTDHIDMKSNKANSNNE